jgi:hypothetical protein
MNDHHDDELTRRFRAVFNKEPVSQATNVSAWKADIQGEYEVDDEEVNISSRNTGLIVHSSEG